MKAIKHDSMQKISLCIFLVMYKQKEKCWLCQFDVQTQVTNKDMKYCNRID